MRLGLFTGRGYNFLLGGLGSKPLVGLGSVTINIGIASLPAGKDRSGTKALHMASEGFSQYPGACLDYFLILHPSLSQIVLNLGALAKVFTLVFRKYKCCTQNS